jgi:pimeloyl-ACP methyl ester carboxylesterase
VATDLWVGDHPSPEDAHAPLVVLVHGSMDRSAAFARCRRHLRDLHVVVYDRRGYGRSAGLGAPDIDGHADDLIAVIDGRPCVVVGHSIGGLFALVAAQRAAPPIRAVGAFETPMPWVGWWPADSAGGAATIGAGGGDPAAVAERFMRRMIGDERWEGLPEGTKEARRVEGAALLAELVSMRSGRAAYDIGEIRVPVVAGRGSESRPHHIRTAETLAELAGQRGGAFVVEGAGHGAHVSHPEQFAAFVRLAVASAGEGSPLPS